MQVNEIYENIPRYFLEQTTLLLTIFKIKTNLDLHLAQFRFCITLSIHQ